MKNIKNVQLYYYKTFISISYNTLLKMNKEKKKVAPMNLKFKVSVVCKVKMS